MIEYEVVLLLITHVTLPTLTVRGQVATPGLRRRPKTLGNAHGCFVRFRSLPLTFEASGARVLVASTSDVKLVVRNGSGGGLEPLTTGI